MTQGYGPDDAQQGQWGQDGQDGQNPPPAPPAAHPQWGAAEQPAPAPQWGQASPVQEPQWGQASPAAASAAAPGGHPGAAGAQSSFAAGAGAAGSPSTVANLVRWMFYGVLALIAVRLIIMVVNIGVRVAGDAMSSADMVGVSGIVSLLGLCANGLVSLAVLALAIMVIVQATGRGRTGAIIVVATIVLAAVVFWLVHGTFLALMANASSLDSIAVMALVAGVAEIIRSLIVFAALIIGAMMSRRWAAQTAA